MRPIVCLLPFLLLACDGGTMPGEEEGKAPPPPAQLCDQAREALQKLGPAIVYDDEGQATIPRQAWLGMAQQARDGLARTLGIHAACVHPDGKSERQVVIRDESGLTLSQAIVPVAIGLDALDDQ